MMLKRYFLVFTLALVAGLCTHCTSEESSDDLPTKTRRPAKFELPFNNASAQRGKTFRVEVAVHGRDEINHLKVFAGDTILFEGTPQKTSYTFQLPTHNWNVGTHQISLRAKLADGKVKRDNRIIRVLSDVYPKEFTAEAIKVYPHNTTSYTQGLEFDEDQLYEGSGGRGVTGKSRVMKVDLNSGKTLVEQPLPSDYFGEGITILEDRLYQLTWQENTCFVYDKNTLEELKTFSYSGEGWGLCNDGQHLIMSDGTERISFIDPENFSLKKTIEVYSNEGPIKALNELEYINGKIYANVYQTNMIVIIDPATGIVTGRIDGSIIALDHRKSGEVMNGIAYKKSTKQLFITGKNWPSLIEIGLVE